MNEKDIEKIKNTFLNEMDIPKEIEISKVASAFNYYLSDKYPEDPIIQLKILNSAIILWIRDFDKSYEIVKK